MAQKVFLDTNIFKFTASGPLSFIPVNRKIRNWYGRLIGFQFYEIGYVNRNEKIRNPELRREVNLLMQIAELSKRGVLELLVHREAIHESWGLPAMGSPTGPIYGAPITDAEAPIKYGRTLLHPEYSADNLTKMFLAGIRDKRFKQLAKLTGGYQGNDKYNLNQMLDAFYIWCAEHNNCDYLLTLDFKLVRVVRNSRRINLAVKLVRPSELLDDIGEGNISSLFTRATTRVKKLLER
jgi:hypothetical protein